MAAISSRLSCTFSAARLAARFSRLVELGITVMPWASSQASDTWAAETPWRWPISISSGSASTLP